MKINSKILSLPPHISTTWGNIAALHMKGSILVINLVDGETVQIPDLKPEQLESIFQAHVNYLEEKTKQELVKPQQLGIFPFHQIVGEPGETEQFFRVGIGGMDNLGTALQHNPAQANLPNMPDEVLDKIRSIAKIIAPDDPVLAPKPEPHCNCMHCQIARAINQGLGHQEITGKEESQQEVVSDQDLSFQQWEIKQTDEKLYTVVNRLDTKERYNVFLGHPVGCTCGKEGCEHIVAVLKS